MNRARLDWMIEEVGHLRLLQSHRAPLYSEYIEAIKRPVVQDKLNEDEKAHEKYLQELRFELKERSYQRESLAPKSAPLPEEEDVLSELLA